MLLILLALVPTCQQCHPQIAASFQHVSMSQTFGRVDAQPVIEDFTQSEFFDGYRVTQCNGHIFQQRGAFELEATHIVGSGKHARTYLHQSANGELVELPLSWYSQEKRWALSPGIAGFTRTIDAGCLFCHNAYPAGVRGEFAARPVWREDLPSGIDCQRCHGQGVDHTRSTIVNPKRLSPKLQMDICLQCHLQTTSAKLPHALRRFGRDTFSYRPGEPLDAYILQFDREQDDRFEVNSAGYRLLQSACFRKSGGKLLCTTCHNPHSPQTVSSKTCLGCHSPHGESENCIGCHMPKRRTQDAVHVSLTDHRIARRPFEKANPAPQKPLHFYEAYELPPLDRALYLGLALVTDAADIPQGVRLLRNAIAKKPNAPVEARAGLARALAQQGRNPEALEQCEIALASHPELATVRAECAKVLENMGRTAAALEEYRRALKDSPDLPSAALGIARSTTDASEADASYRVAARSLPARAEALTNLGNLLTTQGEPAAARNALEEALAIDPTLAEAENNLGRAIAAAGDLRGALPHLERALLLKPDYVEARLNRARVLQALKK